MIEEFGLPFDGMYQRSFGGRAYTGSSRPGARSERHRRGGDRHHDAGVARHAPARAARRVLEDGVVEQTLARWPRWQAEFVSEVSALLQIDVTALDDAAIVAHLNAAIDLLRRGRGVHFRLFTLHRCDL